MNCGDNLQRKPSTSCEEFTVQSKATLHQMLRAREFIVAPGAYDCIGANAVQQAGFPALYMTGMGTSLSRHGLPDYGLVTMSEMVANASAIASSVAIPVIADADTGYGNELNMVRTVHEYERQGIAAIHIEDQVFPKRCGHLGQKQVVPAAEFVSKIRAAVNARSSKDFLIIARTDANAVHGFEDAVSRANAALDVGANFALVEAPETIAQLEAVPRLVHGPCVLNVLVGGRSPLLPLHQIQEMGYRCVLLSDLLLNAALGAYDRALQGTHAMHEVLHLDPTAPPAAIFSRFGAAAWDGVRPQHEPA
jgi:2-methylisocitrate lyase-like PEP mutase family enzyme